MSATTETAAPIERKERKESLMSKSFSRMTSKLDGGDKEYVWGCVLSKEAAEYDWDHEEEDDDEDYCQHNLLLRTAVLGKTAKEGERNIVEAVTKDHNGKELICPILSLTLGKMDMICLDLSFSEVTPVKFRLAEGSGPVHMTGNNYVQYPDDPEADADATELEYTEDDGEETEATETEGDEEVPTKKGAKRKGGKQGGRGKQKGRLDSSAASTGEDEVDDDEEDSDEEEDEEEDMEDDDISDDDDEDEDEEEEEDIESSPEKPKSKKKGKPSPKAKASAKAKASSKSPSKAKKTAKPAKKAGKKGKK